MTYKLTERFLKNEIDGYNIAKHRPARYTREFASFNLSSVRELAGYRLTSLGATRLSEFNRNLVVDIALHI